MKNNNWKKKNSMKDIDHKNQVLKKMNGMICNSVTFLPPCGKFKNDI